MVGQLLLGRLRYCSRAISSPSTGPTAGRYSWPAAYHVAWLPYYDRFVVTASADCPEGFGYWNFAIGSFGIETPLKGGARRVICDDWHNLRSAGEQQRWAYLFNIGLISKEEADAWAEEVWPSKIEIKC
jgi:hypothetical protein